MYVGYMDTILGLLKIKASNKYLLEVKRYETNKNYVRRKENDLNPRRNISNGQR